MNDENHTHSEPSSWEKIKIVTPSILFFGGYIAIWIAIPFYLVAYHLWLFLFIVPIVFAYLNNEIRLFISGSNTTDKRTLANIVVLFSLLLWATVAFIMAFHFTDYLWN